MVRKLLIFVLFLHFCPKAMLKETKEKKCMTCGYEGESTRIVNGDLVDHNIAKYPWMVSLSQVGGDIFCTAALISSKYVLTAAHCMHDYDKMNEGECDEDICYLNATHLEASVWHDSDEEPTERFDVDEVIPHPKYEVLKGVMVHDIALLKLTKKVRCDEDFGPICLMTNMMSDIDEELHIAGWGFATILGDKNTGEKRKLREGILKQIPSELCSRSAKAAEYSDTVICGGVSAKHKQFPCQGDSGSSLFKKINGSYFSLGVGSSIIRKANSEPCALNAKVKFTKVYNHLDWIQQYIKELPEPE